MRDTSRKSPYRSIDDFPKELLRLSLVVLVINIHVFIIHSMSNSNGIFHRELNGLLFIE